MWKDLSIKDKAQIMQIGLSQGINNLSLIKELYNEVSNNNLDNETKDINTLSSVDNDLLVKNNHNSINGINKKILKESYDSFLNKSPQDMPYKETKESFLERAYKEGKINYQDNNVFAYGGKKDTSNSNVRAKAIAYFRNKGMSNIAAAGLVGNLMRESSLNFTALNKKSGAYGLAQWLGNRKKALFNKYGSNPTFENQLDFIWHELNTSHKRGLDKLNKSKSLEEAATNAFGYYEFSGGPTAAVRAMNKTGQNGLASLREGIKYAGGKYAPIDFNLNLSSNSNTVAEYTPPENVQFISIPNIDLSELNFQKKPLNTLTPINNLDLVGATDIYNNSNTQNIPQRSKPILPEIMLPDFSMEDMNMDSFMVI